MDQMPVTITKVGDMYLATLNGGWWMAYGNTPKEAAKRVEGRWRAEHDKR
jgi:hypothetical protein